jgi:hypothetical protein
VTIAPEDQPLVDFLGYGPSPRDVKLVFFGQEEGCHRTAIEVNLAERRRLPFPTDKDDACRRLEQACQREGLDAAVAKYRNATTPGCVRQWSLAARFAKHFFGSVSWESEYRDLGKPHGRTFLAERFPLPRPWNRHPFDGRNERSLTKGHLDALRRGLVEQLEPGTVVVSYAGPPTDLVGRMVRTGRRAWTRIDDSKRDRTWARIARPMQYPLVVLAMPKPEKGDENWWEKWIPAAVAKAKELQATIPRREHAPLTVEDKKPDE